MDVFAQTHARIVAAIDALKRQSVIPEAAATAAVTVEPPKEASHGEIATNAAMVLAKEAKQPPRELAENLVAELRRDPDIAKAEIAGPGFINLTLRPEAWFRVLTAILSSSDFGRSGLGRGEAVNVEYVSANPTGPMHVGHCRGAVFGDALANLLAFAGYDVTREYYVNDAGAQVDVLARSAVLRYREALGEDIGEIPEGLYPGDYLIPVGQALVDLHGPKLRNLPESEWLPIVRDAVIQSMLAMIKDDLAALGIRHDVFFSERSLIEGEAGDRVAETVAELEEKNLVYKGRLPPPKGKLPDDWEDREQLLFRSTEFGDDGDRPLKKPDLSYTYFASDIAYHRDKFRRGFNHMIDVWGADHAGHVKRMQAAIAALTGGRADLDIKICQLVRLFRAGEPVKMSKRAGTFVTLRDVVEEVGPGPVRFMMLYRKNDAPLDFDFAKVTEQSRDNPVFYVQYAHARASSVMRNVRGMFPDLESEGEGALVQADLILLKDEAELALARRLAYYPRVIEAASQAHEPHRIAFYLHELAADFHALWNRGKDSPQLRFIYEGDRKLTVARIALVAATRRVLASGLSILGVEAMHELH
jgi:arginyl-tRNA synthetase